MARHKKRASAPPSTAGAETATNSSSRKKSKKNTRERPTVDPVGVPVDEITSIGGGLALYHNDSRVLPGFMRPREDREDTTSNVSQMPEWQRTQMWIQYRLTNDVIWHYPSDEDQDQTQNSSSATASSSAGTNEDRGQTQHGETTVPGLASQYQEVRNILLQTLEYHDNQSTLLVGPR